MMIEDEQQPSLPPCSSPHLIGLVMEIGPVIANDMGRSPIGWIDIAGWQKAMGVQLEPWTCRLIRKLSLEYLSESRKAEDVDCPEPFAEVNEAQRETVDAKIRRIFDGLLSTEAATQRTS